MKTKILSNNKQVFESMAPYYLREDSHRGYDIDIIKASLDELLNGKNILKWLDVGIGLADTTSFLAGIYPEVDITGIDYSPSMLREAQARINNLELDNITLKNADIIEENIAGEYDIITFMNNGLGNLYKSGNEEKPEDIRRRVVRKIDDALNDGGYFVLSVYNRGTLGIGDKYGRNLEIIKELSKPESGDFFCNYFIGGKKVPYYSHWFSLKELYELAEGTNLKLDFLESRMSRFVARYVKDVGK